MRRLSLLTQHLALISSLILVSAVIASGQDAVRRPEANIPAVVVPAEDAQRAGETAPGSRAAAEQKAAAPLRQRKYFPYTVRPGDTLGIIAQYFGVAVTDLAKVNRMSEADELNAGETLKIPNPFEATQKNLASQVDQLSNETRDTSQKLEQAKAQVASLTGKNNDLTADNASLQDSVKVLPWWRGTAVGMMAASLLLLGVTALTLFEWWMMRRRFAALSDLSLSLGRLDVKYKEMLAKAELRMQQLYGRRRPAGTTDPVALGLKTADEIEIEHLNHELKEALERHLERLGVRGRSARRSRWREVLGAEDEPTGEPRTIRR